MYDSKKIAIAWKKVITDFEPDMFHNPFDYLTIGPELELLDYNLLKLTDGQLDSY